MHCFRLVTKVLQLACASKLHCVKMFHHLMMYLVRPYVNGLMHVHGSLRVRALRLMPQLIPGRCLRLAVPPSQYMLDHVEAF